MTRCAGCGYDRALHDAGKCPLCACGEVPAAHGGIPWVVPACPGGRISKATRLNLLLRQATFREPEPAAARRDWFGMSVPMTDAELVARVEQVTERQIDTRPRVPARPPQGPREIAGAGGGKQASKLGRAAGARGWSVSALYWQGADGTEGCGVWLAKAECRAVALWSRAVADAGKTTGWKADIAYAWRTDVAGFPTKLTHTDLERLIL